VSKYALIASGGRIGAERLICCRSFGGYAVDSMKADGMGDHAGLTVPVRLSFAGFSSQRLMTSVTGEAGARRSDGLSGTDAVNTAVIALALTGREK
jgi:hypothetical protein